MEVNIELVNSVLVSAIYELNDESEAGRDRAWEAGYVTAMIHAAETVLELAGE